MLLFLSIKQAKSQANNPKSPPKEGSKRAEKKSVKSSDKSSLKPQKKGTEKKSEEKSLMKATDKKPQKTSLKTGSPVPVQSIILSQTASETLNSDPKNTGDNRTKKAMPTPSKNSEKLVLKKAETKPIAQEIDFEQVPPMSDEELLLIEPPADKPRLTRSEIEKQMDFQKEAMIHIDALYNFAVRMTGDPEDANDLVQETYMKAYRFFESFEKGTNCKAWLFRILKNSYINKYRKESKEPDKVDYDDIKDFYHSVKHSSLDSNDMQEQLFGELLDDEVSRALEGLPDDFKEVVQLCDIEGFTYEEIANMVDCPIGTVRSRLHRGRKILRDKLIGYAQHHGYKINPEEWD